MTERIGKYQIIRELGEGGFGKVFLATDPQLANRRVAIKVMTTAEDAGLRQRFRNEAVTAASLKHPNIVTILEYGEHEDRPFIAMEYLEGEDLAKRQSHEPALTLFQKVNILDQTAAGLYAAHSHPSVILHRDIKPANVMLLRDGTVKIMDFGIARLSADKATRLTSANMVIGSIAYMAPEQLTHGVSDVLTDIWSFGVLAYELLSGINPFTGDEKTQIMYRITCVEPPPLTEVMQECPPELSAIVMRALHKQRTERYQSLEDTGFDLRIVLGELRTSLAQQILQSAENLYATGDLDASMRVVREALEIDTDLRDARFLREKLLRELRQRAQQKRIAELLTEAQGFETAEDFDEALARVWEALQLDPMDAGLQSRHDALKQLKVKKEHYTSALEAGFRELAAGNLAEAERHVADASSFHLGANAVAELRLRVEEERTRREQQQQKAQAEQQRQELIRETLSDAYQLCKRGEVDLALARVNETAGRVGDAPEIARVLQELTQAVEARDRTAEVARKLETIERLVREKQLDRARQACDLALRQYPSDPLLLGQSALIAQLLAKHAVEARAAELLQRGNFEEAIAFLQAELKNSPADASLLALAATARQKQKDQLVQNLISEVRTHADQKRWKTASAAWEKAAALDPSHPALAGVSEELARGRAEHLAMCCGEVQSAIAVGEYKRSADLLADMRSRFPEEASIASLSQALTEAKKKHRDLPRVPSNVAAAKGAEGPPARSRVSKLWWIAEILVLLAGASARRFLTTSDSSKQQVSRSISAKPSSLEFRFQTGSAEMPAQELNLAGVSSTIDTAAPDWVDVHSAIQGDAAKLTVTLKPEQLAAGEHSGTMMVTSGGVTVQIPVRAVVTERDAHRLSADRHEVQFTETQTAAVLALNAPAPVSFRISGAPDWLSVTPASGRAPARIQLKALTGRVPPGEYSASLTILGDNSASAEAVLVRLKVRDAGKQNNGPIPDPRTGDAKKPDPPPPPPQVTVRQDWGGLESGMMVWRGQLLPGATIELTKDSVLENSRKFPWITVTTVMVQALPPAVVVEQPSRANSWNRIRVANQGTQTLETVTLSWKIE